MQFICIFIIETVTPALRLTRQLPTFATGFHYKTRTFSTSLRFI
jgi:hypothetical protein